MDTKVSIWIYSITLLMIIYSCKKQEDIQIPTLSTVNLSDTTQSSVKSGGIITSDGGAAIISRGVCWSTKENPTELDKITYDGKGVGTYSSIIYGLSSNTVYYIRAYAKNSKGTGYGNVIKLNSKVAISTNLVSEIGQISATCGGKISKDGIDSIVLHGVCWSTNQSPTLLDNRTEDGGGKGDYSSNITGLMPNTTYYIRAYAKNSAGASYGDEKTFVTLKNGIDVDAIGNIYDTIVIGTQVWMKQNLKTTKYSDGTPIPLYNYSANKISWSDLKTPCYSWYDNRGVKVSTYGPLYNWYVVKTNKLCPAGWHVPSQNDWNVMRNYLIANGYNYDKSKTGNFIAKSLAATTGWDSDTTKGNVGRDLSSNNSSGFSAFPGGSIVSTSGGLGVQGNWWASSEYPANDAVYGWVLNSKVVGF